MDLLQAIDPRAAEKAEELFGQLFPSAEDKDQEKVMVLTLCLLLGRVVARRTKLGDGSEPLLMFGLNALQGMLLAAAGYYAAQYGIQLVRPKEEGETRQ